MIEETGVIAILRASSANKLIQACSALMEGGIRAVEVTLTTPGALQTIEQARRNFPAQFFFGAGSVTTLDQAQQAITAGAQFLVSPTINPEVIAYCVQMDIPACPGGFTATEIFNGWQAGARWIKVFPASVGGPAMIKALKAPLPQIPLMAVGGVDLENAAEWIRAGCIGLGVGSSLVNDRLLAEENFAEIKRRAAGFIAAVRNGRASKTS